jgi:hypothetical protein
MRGGGLGEQVGIGRDGGQFGQRLLAGEALTPAAGELRGHPEQGGDPIAPGGSVGSAHPRILSYTCTNPPPGPPIGRAAPAPWRHRAPGRVARASTAWTTHIPRARMSSGGATARADQTPMASPIPAGSAVLPAAEAATWRLTAALVAPASAPPSRAAVVRVKSGKMGAAARPSSSRPSTASHAGPGTAITAAPALTPATAAASTRGGPRRSATVPRTTRPANIMAQ